MSTKMDFFIDLFIAKNNVRFSLSSPSDFALGKRDAEDDTPIDLNTLSTVNVNVDVVTNIEIQSHCNNDAPCDDFGISNIPTFAKSSLLDKVEAYEENKLTEGFDNMKRLLA